MGAIPRPAEHMKHTFWHCTNAKVRWDDLISMWTHIGTAFDLHSAIALFDHRLPSLPTSMLTSADVSAQDPVMLDIFHGVAKIQWEHECANTLADIWNLRHDVAHGLPAPQAMILNRQTAQLRQARTILARRLTDHVDPAETAALKTLMVHCELRTTTHSNDGHSLHHSLGSILPLPPLFDGGSRGNPVPEDRGQSSSSLWGRPTTRNHLDCKHVLQRRHHNQQHGRILWSAIRTPQSPTELIGTSPHHLKFGNDY